MQSIDRLVRSGNILYDPVDESGNDPFDATATGYMFRIYTQAEQSASQDARCALWLVDDEERLLYRTWPVLTPEDASNWTVVAEVWSTGPSTSPRSRWTPLAARSPSASP